MLDLSSDEDILSFRNQLDGEPLCIIANGPSVKTINLKKITCATMGLNKAWMLGEWDYYVMGDTKQYKASAHKRLSPLFSYPNGPDHAIKINLLFDEVDRRRISLDLTKGIYGNNTVTAFGLQVAFWLGADPIYLLGVDCANRPDMGHFWGGKEVPERKFSKHREGYGYIQGYLDGIADMTADMWCGDPRRIADQYLPTIINLNLDSRCSAFERQNFDSVFRGE